jgi:hypothetical protein
MGWTAGGKPTQFSIVLQGELAAMQKQFALKFLQNILDIAPVLTGAYRANNIISIGAPDLSYDIEKLDPDSSQTLRDGFEVLKEIPDGTYPTIYVQNNIPYCEDLEDGTSRKAPSGVYGLSFQNAKESFK